MGVSFFYTLFFLGKLSPPFHYITIATTTGSASAQDQTLDSSEERGIPISRVKGKRPIVISFMDAFTESLSFLLFVLGARFLENSFNYL